MQKHIGPEDSIQVMYCIASQATPFYMFASEFKLGLELGSIEVLGVLLYKDKVLERYVRHLF